MSCLACSNEHKEDLLEVKRAEIVQTYMGITVTCCRSSLRQCGVAHVVVFILTMDQHKFVFYTR